MKKYLEIPRITDDSGQQRYDLFAFQLKNDVDNSKLKPKTIVDLTPGDAIHYLKPWYSTDTDLSVQLQREISKKHALYGKEVKTIARRQDNDDALFEVEGAAFKYAMVHLTWAAEALENPIFPTTKTYKDWQEVYENRIVVDHEDWEVE